MANPERVVASWPSHAHSEYQCRQCCGKGQAHAYTRRRSTHEGNDPNARRVTADTRACGACTKKQHV
eukprot:2246568-Alexandrium_andersonii.AAC.1